MFYVSALSSLEGGKDQSLHADFTYFDFVRFAGILIFDDDTAINVQIDKRRPKQKLKFFQGMQLFLEEIFGMEDVDTKKKI